METTSRDSEYSYLDLARRSGESLVTVEAHRPAVSEVRNSQQPHFVPAPLAPPVYSSTSSIPLQNVTVMGSHSLYGFPRVSESMPSFASPNTVYVTQSRRPVSQVHSGDINYLSSPPGISQLSLRATEIPRQFTAKSLIEPPHQPPRTDQFTSLRGPPSIVNPQPIPTFSSNLVASQPLPTPDMSTNFKGTRNARCLPTGVDGMRTWSTGLLNCYQEHTCDDWCLAFWCPCVMYGRNKNRLDHLSQRNRPDSISRDATCNVDCCLHCCLSSFCLFGWALEVPNRAVVRARYNIRGSVMKDFCSSLWCSSCVLAQESSELELEEKSFPREVSRIVDDGVSRVIIA
ncbi:hypothetical protein E1B28_008303 [Marasmius oreades]|uniref:Uncharacterized protein n=1 Tax=Marasmius oreades TaxID=181124 RepID=A0A9P7UT60_9AGAR|nr:uncharacterized protein E1B28_008303 [Marasmius oreades]KAG7091906.1 hypothetical protein E1B28_008303 [Marasmius oreades]